MEIWRLEVLADGVRIVEEIHANRDSASDALWDVVREAWDNDGIGRPFDTVPAKLVVKTFFEAMEEYSYTIKPLEVKGALPSSVPAPVPADPFMGMQPVPLTNPELLVIQSCLRMVAPKDIKRYNAELHNGYSLKDVIEAQRSAIKKMD